MISWLKKIVGIYDEEDLKDKIRMLETKLEIARYDVDHPDVSLPPCPEPQGYIVKDVESLNC